MGGSDWLKIDLVETTTWPACRRERRSWRLAGDTYFGLESAAAQENWPLGKPALNIRFAATVASVALSGAPGAMVCASDRSQETTLKGLGIWRTRAGQVSILPGREGAREGMVGFVFVTSFTSITGFSESAS